MLPTSVYVKEHPRSWCWSFSLPQFKQGLCTSASPSSPSLTKRIWQRRRSEVLGQTYQPHVPSNSPLVSDCMEFMAQVHQLFKDSPVKIWQVINHMETLLPQTYTRLFQNSTETCLHLMNLGFWEYQRLLHQGSLLTSMRMSPTIDLDLSLTPSFDQSARSIDPFTFVQGFWLYWKHFFILNIRDSAFLFPSVAFKSGPEFTLEAYAVTGWLKETPLVVWTSARCEQKAEQVQITPPKKVTDMSKRYHSWDTSVE